MDLVEDMEMVLVRVVVVTVLVVVLEALLEPPKKRLIRSSLSRDVVVACVRGGRGVGGGGQGGLGRQSRCKEDLSLLLLLFVFPRMVVWQPFTNCWR